MMQKSNTNFPNENKEKLDSSILAVRHGRVLFPILSVIGAVILLFSLNKLVQAMLDNEPVYSFGNNGDDDTLDIAWGDWDGDGDLDLATAGHFGIQVYENEKKTLLLAWEYTGIAGVSSFNSNSAAWGDWDGDGDLDLVADEHVFVNIGGMLDSVPAWTAPFNVSETAWGDNDGDGDLDLVTTNHCFLSGCITSYLYENIGGNLSATPVWTATIPGIPVWGDWDNDGDLDLAVGASVYNNVGGNLETTPVWQPTDLTAGLNSEWGDWDNDGFLDLALIPGTRSSIKQSTYVYRNIEGVLAPTRTWEYHDEGHNTLHLQDLKWGDMDNDGDLDLALGSIGRNSVYWGLNPVFENKGGELGFAPFWEASDSFDTNSIAWGDWDGDGDLDLVNGNEDRDQIYENTGSSLFSKVPITLDVEFERFALAFGDLDSDGDLDFGMGGALFDNDGGALNVTPIWSMGGSDSMAWGDWDNDGDLDLATEDGVFQNNAGVLDDTPAWTPPSNVENLAWGDWDNDGDLDLAIGYWGGIQVFENIGGNLTIIPDWERFDSRTKDLAFGDMDNDGDLDLVVGNDGRVNEVYENLGGDLGATPVWQSVESESTRSVSWGDWDGDGDLDIAVGNSYYYDQVYENIGGDFTLAWESNERLYTQDVAWGDMDNDGDPDLLVIDGEVEFDHHVYENIGGDLLLKWSHHDGFGEGRGGDWGDIDNDGDLDLIIVQERDELFIYENHLQGQQNLPNNPATIAITKVGNTANANFYAVGEILEGAVPIHYKLADPEGDPVGRVGAQFSVNGGGLWQEAVQTAGSQTTHLTASPSGDNHTFWWDPLASGFFGQSDNVVVRLFAYPQDPAGTTNTYKYYNSTPGDIQRAHTNATSFPFRVRGSQVRVFSETVAAGNELGGTLVYRSPAGQTGSAILMQSNLGKTYQTHSNGYLQGFGKLLVGDQLLALSPVEVYDNYTVYHTSAAPTTIGLDFHTVAASGVQTLTVSADNTLILYDLVVSLEWDARNDPTFMTQLRGDLQRTSEILYDLSNGQAAIGNIHLYHEKGYWGVADIVIQASNRQRPSAVLGGFVRDLVTDEVTVDGETRTNVYVPGQIRMGPTWNRFGDPNGILGEDWPRVLAHELGHYLFHLPDNYLGLTGDGFLAVVDCAGSAMTDPYVEGYSEFLTPSNWIGDCQNSLAEIYLGRSDWETISTFYPDLDPSGGNVGPSSLPLAVTQIEEFAPDWETQVLDDPFFPLEDVSGNALPLPQGRSQAYLIRTRGNSDPTDDYPVALGSAVGDLVQARGVEPGDRLCVFDYSHDPLRLGCVDSVGAAPTAVILEEVSDWVPDITVTAVNTDTVQVDVTNVSEINLNVQLLPSLGQASAIEAMVPNGDDFTKTVAAADGAYYGYVRVWVPGSDPHKEMIVSFTAVEDWGGSAYAWGGSAYAWGGSAYAWGGSAYAWGGLAYAWGGSAYAWGAPVMSNDGQVSILPLEGLFDNNFDDYTLLSLDLPPTLPSWLTLTGQAYRVKTDGTLPDSVILFRYLARDVPAGEENGLRVYYSPDNGQTWERLETKLNTTRNHASAKLQGDGIYALIATIELSQFFEGWNNFGYPAQTPRPVAEALASIDGKYTSVYNYDTLADEWYLYDATVGSGFAGLVNDLTHLEYTKGYWLYATEDTTGYIGVDGGIQSKFLWGQSVNLQLPPATFYGWVQPTADFTPAVGMVVTAEIDGNVCGQAAVQDWGAQLAFVLEVRAEKLFGAPNGCGAVGKTIVFKVDGTVMDHNASWDTSQAWLHSLSEILAPAAAPQPSLGVNGADVVLGWLHAAQNSNYEVWVSTTPYFAAGDAGATKLADMVGSSEGELLTFTHVGALTDGNHHYYLIRATNGAGGAVSEWGGKFEFEIQPGGS